MKILSYQPFSLYANGGGSRILRRLYEGNETNVVSLTIDSHASGQQKNGLIKEYSVQSFPLARKWHKSFIRDFVTYLRQQIFKSIAKKKVLNAASGINYDVIHVVNHGVYSTALCNKQALQNKQLWVSFHDHFAASKRPPNDTHLLWQTANRRLVISKEMGENYCEMFGVLPYEVITDGVTESEISQPHTKVEPPYAIYFSGLLHIDYLPLFSLLADVLDNLSAKGYRFKMIFRGTQKVSFMNKRSFEVEYRSMTLDNNLLKEEMDAATILYLPIKFTLPYFYLYSLSTKMVGYLGGSGGILYHGPGDSAACKLLHSENAAISCVSMDAQELENSLLKLIKNIPDISSNAKKLASKQFKLTDIQQRFWRHDS